jgi:glutamyl-tRNA reductase
MARLVACRARGLGFASVIVAGRRRPSGAWFEQTTFSFLPLDLAPSAPAVDIAIGCLGADAPLIDAADGLPPVRGLIVDLGTPRNFTGDPAVRVLGISDLHDAAQRHGTERRQTLARELRSIVDRRIEVTRTNRQSVVGAFRAAVERVRQREVSRIAKLHPELSGETVEAITRSLVNQLFHLPSERLKALDDPPLGERFVALFSDDSDLERIPSGRPS